MALKLMITNGQKPKYRNSMWGWSTGGMTLKVNTDVCGEKKNLSRCHFADHNSHTG